MQTALQQKKKFIMLWRSLMKWEGIKVKKWTVLERRIPIDCMDYCYYCLHCMVDSKKDNKVTVWLHQSIT